MNYEPSLPHSVMNSIIQGFPQNNDYMFLSYKFLEMGAACVPNIRVCGGGDGILLSEYYMITYCFQRCHGANIYCVTRDLSAPGCPKVVVAGRCAL